LIDRLADTYPDRDPHTVDVILSQAPRSWEEIFAVRDEAGIPDDFLSDRKQGYPPEREEC
jgi:hypothetical protein